MVVIVVVMVVAGGRGECGQGWRENAGSTADWVSGSQPRSSRYRGEGDA